jgi:hypothetical protein
MKKPPKVSAKNLVPIQQWTRAGFKRHTDCYERQMLKHPHLSVFHSLAELYHAALLEGNPSVSVYVPQPFSLRVGSRYYTPDCYVMDEGKRRVVELKARGDFPEDMEIALKAFFKRYGMVFEVMDNERALERYVLAENWLTIVSLLYSARDYGSEVEEIEVEEALAVSSKPLGHLIDAGNRFGTFMTEVAVFRLLHRGFLTADLSDRPLDYDTEVALCI